MYFDADIQVDGAVSGAGGLVPSTGQFGFIETGAYGATLSAADLAGLIASRDRSAGQQDCVISVGGTAQTMRVCQVEVGNAPRGGAQRPARVRRGGAGQRGAAHPGNWSVGGPDG